MGGAVVVEAGRRKAEEWVIAGSGMVVVGGGGGGRWEGGRGDSRTDGKRVATGPQSGVVRWAFQKSQTPSSHVRHGRARQAERQDGEVGFQNDPLDRKGAPTWNETRGQLRLFPCPVALAGLVGPSHLRVSSIMMNYHLAHIYVEEREK